MLKEFKDAMRGNLVEPSLALFWAWRLPPS